MSNPILIDKFISEEVCDKLIHDADLYLDKNHFIRIQQVRDYLTNTSLGMYDLKKKSIIWNDLTNKLDSADFYEFCCEKLRIDKDNFIKKKFFQLENPSNLMLSFKRNSTEKVALLPTLSLIKYCLIKISRSLYRKLFFSKFFFWKKKPIELLYDYSVAYNGYCVPTHRDSEKRLFIFLLYLNDLSLVAEGGNLEFYSKSHSPKVSFELVDTVKPKKGRLVIFINNEASYHAVNQMKVKFEKQNISRHFIYGGFTLLSQNNPFIRSDSVKDKTGFHLYD
jgi:hypothetical protein